MVNNTERANQEFDEPHPPNPFMVMRDLFIRSENGKLLRQTLESQEFTPITSGGTVADSFNTLYPYLATNDHVTQKRQSEQPDFPTLTQLLETPALYSHFSRAQTNRLTMHHSRDARLPRPSYQVDVVPFLTRPPLRPDTLETHTLIRTLFASLVADVVIPSQTRTFDETITTGESLLQYFLEHPEAPILQVDHTTTALPNPLLPCPNHPFVLADGNSPRPQSGIFQPYRKHPKTIESGQVSHTMSTNTSAEFAELLSDFTIIPIIQADLDRANTCYADDLQTVGATIRDIHCLFQLQAQLPRGEPPHYTWNRQDATTAVWGRGWFDAEDFFNKANFNSRIKLADEPEISLADFIELGTIYQTIEAELPAKDTVDHIKKVIDIADEYRRIQKTTLHNIIQTRTLDSDFLYKIFGRNSNMSILKMIAVGKSAGSVYDRAIAEALQNETDIDWDHKTIEAFSSMLVYYAWRTGEQQILTDWLTSHTTDNARINKLKDENQKYQTATETYIPQYNNSADRQLTSERILALSKSMHNWEEFPSIRLIVEYFEQLDEDLKTVKQNQDNSAHTMWADFAEMAKLHMFQTVTMRSCARKSSFDRWITNIWQEPMLKIGLQQGKSYSSPWVEHPNTIGAYRAQLIFDSLLCFLVESEIITHTDLYRLENRTDPPTDYWNSNFYPHVKSAHLAELLPFFDRLARISGIALPIDSTLAPGRHLYQQFCQHAPTTNLFYPRQTLRNLVLSNQQGNVPLNINTQRDRACALYGLTTGERDPSARIYDIDHARYLRNLATLPPTDLTRYLDYHNAHGGLTKSTAGKLLAATTAHGLFTIESVRNLRLDKHTEELMYRLILLHGLQAIYTQAREKGVPVSFPTPPSTSHTLSITNLYPEQLVVQHFYDKGKLQLLAPNNVHIESGKVLALIGSAGSGKTTLLQALTSAAYKATFGFHIFAEKAEMDTPGTVLLSLNDDMNRASGSRYRNLVETVATFLDTIIELKTKNPDTSVVISLDELFRGTDDINATALIWNVLEYLSSIENVYILTSTHYMLLKDLADAGHISCIQFNSVEPDTHTLTDNIRESELSVVLEGQGYSPVFIRTFQQILRGEPTTSMPTLESALAQKPILLTKYFDAFRELDVLYQVANTSQWKLGNAMQGCSLTSVHKTKPENIALEFIRWLSFEDNLEFASQEGKEHARLARSLEIRQELSSEDYNTFSRFYSDLFLALKGYTHSTRPQQMDQIKQAIARVATTLESEDSGQNFGPNQRFIDELRTLLGKDGVTQLGTEETETLLRDILRTRFKQPANITPILNKYLAYWTPEAIKTAANSANNGAQFIRNLKENSPPSDTSNYFSGSLAETIIQSLDNADWTRLENKDRDNPVQNVTTALQSETHISLLTTVLERARNLDLTNWIRNSNLNFCKTKEGDNIELTGSYYPGQGVTRPTQWSFPLEENTLKRIVRNNVELTKACPTFFTGDNNAGKTVTLKMLILNALLSEACVHAIADRAIMPRFGQIHGVFDVQSSQNKSSSMTEMEKVARVLQTIQEHHRPNSNYRTLAVFDELGSTISSSEGSAFAALVIGILEQLEVETGVTTHYHQLERLFRTYFPDIDTTAYGFVFDEKDKEKQYVAHKGMRPGTSRGVERALHFLLELKGDLTHSEEIERIFQSALERRTVVQEFVMNN